MTTSRASTRLRNLALAAVSTVVLAAIIEGFARFMEPPPVQKQEYLWDWDERFKDGDFYTFEKGEGFPPGEENNVDGLRDVTRPVETREGLRRIVVLGDSVAYGHGVEAAEAFPQILERRLRESGRDVDVFNVALPGWSTRQERIAYERIARKYRPDTVVLAVCLNDLAELQINLTKPPGFLLTLFKHSATVRMALGASKREIGTVEELFTDNSSGRVNDAFRLFFDEVRSLGSEVAKDGATFHIVVFPFRFQVEPKAPAPSVQRRIGEFAAAERISFFDFLPETETIGPSSARALFLDYDHFSKTGHERVAAWLARAPDLVGDAVTTGDDRGDEHFVWSLRNIVGRIKGTSTEAANERFLRLVRERAANPNAEFGLSRPLLNQLVVAQAVDSLSPRVRFQAAQTAFALGPPDEASVEFLIRGLQHEDPRVRAFATWTLGEMGDAAQPAMPALVALAREDGGAGRTGALTAMGKIGGDSPDMIPLLVQELQHPKEARRYRAARTIGRLGSAAAAAIPALTEALRDPSALVRLHVVRAFGNLGDAAKPALPALVEILNRDPDPVVRKEVSLTLSRLPGR